MSSASTLIICVAGLYASFITWSILQEKIFTTSYDNAYFKSSATVTIVQSIFAVTISFVYSLLKDGTNPFSIFTNNSKHISEKYLTQFTIISLTSSITGPISTFSVKHVDFLVYLLSKSCKLIPIMIVHGVIYRTKFPTYKFIVAGMVTLGVIVFTTGKSASKKTSNNDGKTLLGIGQLCLSMLLDGLTNSTQDQLFQYQKAHANEVKVKINGIILMCVLNFFMVVNTVLYTLVFNYDEISYVIDFGSKHPEVARDILVYAIFGSVGQIFIFILLEKFDSIILTTATVTRKMLSMVCSVVLFGHALNAQQIFGVFLVFIGIGYEAWLKVKSKPSKDTKVESSKPVNKPKND